MKNTLPKVSFAAALCLGAAIASGSGGQTWYCTKGDATKVGSAYPNNTFNDPSYWHLADGTVMTEFSTEDDYYLCNTTYLQGAPTFPGGPLHLGSVAEDKSVTVWIYSGNIPTHGVVLEKGNITCNRGGTGSAHSLIGDVMVVAPRSAPFRVAYRVSSATFFMPGAVTGKADTALRFSDGAKDSVGAVLTDVTGYHGLIAMTSTVENVSSSTGFKLSFKCSSFPGSLEMSRNTVLQMDNTAASSAMTISNMTFHAGSRIVITGTSAAHSSFSATGSMTAEPGVEIVLNFAVPISPETNTIVLLSAPVDGANFTKDDFVFDASKSDWKQLYHLDTVVENGVKSLVAVFEPLVKQTNTYPYEYDFRNDEGYKASSMTNAAYWSDNLVPHGGVRYYTSYNLRTVYSPYTVGVFPGLSLTLEGGSLRVFNSEYTVTNLIVSGGTIQYGNIGDTTKPFHSEMISLRDGKTLTFETYLGHGIDIDSEISGNGRLWFSGIRREATSSPSAHYILRKANEDFGLFRGL